MGDSRAASRGCAAHHAAAPAGHGTAGTAAAATTATMGCVAGCLAGEGKCDSADLQRARGCHFALGSGQAWYVCMERWYVCTERGASANFLWVLGKPSMCVWRGGSRAQRGGHLPLLCGLWASLVNVYGDMVRVPWVA
eukprot:scaffold16736_cov22-Tisochrysis_lutea.AAC.1